MDRRRQDRDDRLVTPRGFEPPTNGLGNHCSIRAELRGHACPVNGAVTLLLPPGGRQQVHGRAKISRVTVSDVITSDPEIQGGAVVFTGPRVPLKNLIDYLEAGDSLEEFLDDFPSVSREQAVAALELAREALVTLAGAR